VARSCAFATQSSTEPSTTWTVAPSPAAESVLAIDASLGMKTSQGTPRARAA
jgi:hypothetical protein